MMTLREWSVKSGIKPTTPTTEKGAVSVVIDPITNHHRAALWALEDYLVTSAGGAVIWLTPKKVS